MPPMPIRHRWSDFKQRLFALTDDTQPPLPHEVAQLLEKFGNADAADRHPHRNLWLSVAFSVRSLLIKAAVVSLLTALAGAGAIISGMQILRIKSGSLDMQAIGVLIGVFFCMNLLAVWGGYIGNRLRATVGLAVETVLAHRLTAKFWHIRHRNLQQMPSGSLKVLFSTDARNVGSFMDNAVRNLLPVLAASLVAIPLLAVFAGWAGLAGFATMLLLIPISGSMGRFSAIYQRRIQTTLDRLTALTGEWVTNMRLIRYLDWEQAILRDLSAIMRRLTVLSMRQSLFAFVVFGLSVSWWMISIAMVAVAAKWLHIGINLAQFFGAIWLITMLHGYLMHIPTTIRLYANAAASMKIPMLHLDCGCSIST